MHTVLLLTAEKSGLEDWKGKCCYWLRYLQLHDSHVVQIIKALMTCLCMWQVPQGATPRSLVIHLRGPLTRTCKPGDSVTVAGVFLPQPYTGFRAMRAGLLTTTYLDAMSVTQDKRSYKDTAADDSLRTQIEVGARRALLLHCCADILG